MIGKFIGKFLFEFWCNNDDIFILGKVWCKFFICFVLNLLYLVIVIMFFIYKNDLMLLCFFMCIFI